MGESEKPKWATVQINALKSGTVGRKEIKTTHLWYDTKTKKMHKFYGGQLKFDYDTETKETKVSVAPLYAFKRGMSANIWQIRQWFSENFDDKVMELVEDATTHLTFAFRYKKDEELENIKDELYAQRFDYDITDINA
jgi:hypothetical protein